jgi:hypothetical protein
MNLTYEDLLEDPDRIEKALAAARRERAAAVNTLIVQPIKRLLNEAPQGSGGVLTMRRCSNPGC